MDTPVRLETMAGDDVSRLGLAGNPEMEGGCVEMAYNAGVNYFFFYNLTFTGMIDDLPLLLNTERESVVVATGTESRNLGEMNTHLDQVRRRLDVDMIDLFFAEYISPSDDVDAMLGSRGAIEQMWKWQAEGKIRYVAVTTHNRPLALKLIKSGRVEVLMHRYNMAHRGSEEQVLPAAQAVGIPVVSFTNTRWGSLLKGHTDWDGSVPTAADCYRFVLNHPAVRLALTAPATVAQLEENLSVLQDEGVPDTEEMDRWKAYGSLVYGKGTDAFETQWP